MSPFRWATFALVAAQLPRTADAADSPTVDVGHDWNREVSLGDGFVAVGAAEPDIDQVFLVLVPSPAPAFGALARPHRCDNATFEKLDLDLDKLRALTSKGPFVGQVADVTTDAGRLGKRAVVVPKPWRRPPTDPPGSARFSVSVPASDLFGPGKNACAIALPVQNKVVTSVQTAFATLQKTPCTGSADACATSAQNAIFLATDGSKLSPAERERLKKNVSLAYDPALASSIPELQGSKLLSRFPLPLGPDVGNRVRETPWALLVGRVLAERGHLQLREEEWWHWSSPGGSSLRVDSFWLEVGPRVSVGFAPDNVGLSADAELGGAPLRDVLLLAAGQVWVDERIGVLPLSELARRAAWLPWSPHTDEIPLLTLQAVIGRLDAVVKLAYVGWRDDKALQTSRSDAAIVFRLLQQADLTFDRHGTPGGTLGSFVARLEAFQGARTRVETAFDQLEASVETASEPTAAAIQDRSWVRQDEPWNAFIQQNVGITWSSALDQPTLTIGASISPWPNPPGQPGTLANGDLQRAISLQVGIKGVPGTPDTEPFGVGPNLVVGPLAGIPPVFAGVGVRAVSLCDLGVGAMIYGLQPGGFTDARRQLAVEPYFSVSVRVDLVNAITKVFGGS